MINIKDDEDAVFDEPAAPAVEVQTVKVAAAPVPKAVVYRSRETGKPISREEYLKERSLDESMRRVKKSAAPRRVPEHELPWGGGLVQKTVMVKEREAHESAILAEPLHISEVSASRDDELKVLHRAEDPLLLMNGAEGEEKHRPPSDRCPFPTPPNRFNIKAGSKWDGKVRGTGFEARLLKVLNARRGD